ncbi:hypothetical protein BJ741DRAFT_616380 [Chytriomyces cf. hyalinus JEL632]|nr:hypothetical protein BJ741DRAFT_616380 [Chytriomyces cf. hyalinus JEL632]
MLLVPFTAMLFASGTLSSIVRCGLTWEEANDRCGFDCDVDGDCPGEQRCYADMLNTAVCDGKIPGSDLAISAANPSLTPRPSESGSSISPSQVPPVSATVSVDPSRSDAPGSNTASSGVPASGVASPAPTGLGTNSPSTSGGDSTNSGSSTTQSGTNASPTASPVGNNNNSSATNSINGLPSLPECATKCFTAANLTGQPLAAILKSFCGNETAAATSVYACIQQPCSSASDKNDVIRYINSLGSDCANQGLGPSNWTFAKPGGENTATGADNASSQQQQGLSGLWIGLISLFAVLALVLLGTCIYLCCVRKRKDTEVIEEQRREHYNHVHV